MSSLGRSKEQFQFVDGAVSEVILQRTKHALTQIPIRSNPYLQWILTGEFPNIEDTHPYLSTEGLKRLKAQDSTLTFVHSGVVEYLKECEPNSIDAFNFSNIFEYLSPTEHEEIRRRSIRAAKAGARVAYSNLLAPRSCPVSLRDELKKTFSENLSNFD